MKSGTTDILQCKTTIVNAHKKIMHKQGYQDDSKQLEENLRYCRGRNLVADAIRKKLNL